MVRIKEAIVVEGRYDTMRLSTLVDTVIVQTNGFRIFKDEEQRCLLRRLAATQGLIVLTDSDAAGFVIRDHIAAVVPPEQIKHAYIPPQEGKERRKTVPSKEGLLGVEGMHSDVLLHALKAAGATFETENDTWHRPYLTMARMMEDGLTGCADSKQRRAALCQRLQLPLYLSTSRLMAVINATVEEETYVRLIQEL